MFRIDTTRTIWINKGDTASTPFYLDEGTPLVPLYHAFNSRVFIEHSSNLNNTEIDFDKDVWSNKVLDSGVYEFVWVFSESEWELDGVGVTISDYGIYLPHILQSSIPDGATITVTYTLYQNEDEIYFYIWQPLQQVGQPAVLKKTIIPSTNTIIVEKNGETLYTEKRNCVDSEGNIILYFNPQDTSDMPQGEYRYQIIAKLYNSNIYEVNTVTNRTPFIVIEDDYSDRVWS